MRNKTKDRQARRTRREWYLSHGICPHCGRNDLQKGYKLCLECRMKDNERQRKKVRTDEQRKKNADAQKRLTAKRKADGICVRCGKRKVDGKYTYCAVCRAKKAAKQREYNRKQGMIPIELRGEGYCSRCYKPIESGKLCAECYEYLVKQAAYMRSRQDNSNHTWRKASETALNIAKCSQTNGEPPRIDFNLNQQEVPHLLGGGDVTVLGGKVTLEENKRHTEAI